MVDSKITKTSINWVIEENLKNDDILNKIFEVSNHFLDVFEDEKEKYSTKGELSKQVFLKYANMDIKDKKFLLCCDYIKKIVLKNLKKFNIIDEYNYDLKLATAWTVLSDQNSYHITHDHHPYNGVSTVLYLNVPENKNNLDDGNIFFVLDCGPYNPIYSNYNRILHVKPQKNSLLIFPSWLIHGVYSQPKGERITFNVDYNIVPKKTVVDECFKYV